MNGVTLCKLRPFLLRLPGIATFAGVWLAILIIVTLELGGGLARSCVEDGSHAAFDPGFRHRQHQHQRVYRRGAVALFPCGRAGQARQVVSARARIDALQARIRPHFLFNSMLEIRLLPWPSRTDVILPFLAAVKSEVMQPPPYVWA